MIHSCHRAMVAVLLLVMVCVSPLFAVSPPPVEAVISARIVDGGVNPSSEFVVGIFVEEYASKATARTLSLRLHLASKSAAFLEFLEPPRGIRVTSRKVAEAQRPFATVDTTWDVTVSGDLPTTSTQNLLASLKFKVVKSPRYPFTIFVEPQPGMDSPLVSAVGKSIPVRIDGSRLAAISNRGVMAQRPPVKESGPLAVVQSTLMEPQPLKAGDLFTLKVAISENPTGKMPISCNFRVYFPPDRVEYVGLTRGDLGGLYAGKTEDNDFDAAKPRQFRDFVAAGNFEPKTLTPVCCVMSFRVLPNAPAGSFALHVEADPASSAALIGPKSRSRIPHRYDNSRITNLVIAEPSSPAKSE